jgi:hypothetical protein
MQSLVLEHVKAKPGSGGQAVLEHELELSYSKLQNSWQKRRGGQSVQGKTEDAGGLSPVKDNNVAMRTLHLRTFARNSDDCYRTTSQFRHLAVQCSTLVTAV